MSNVPPTRRDFLTAAGLVPVTGGLLSTELAHASDSPRDLKPGGADLGSLFPDVEKLARANRYTFSLSGGRFPTFDAYKAAARDKVHDLLLYRPEKVDPKVEVVERVRREGYVREKVIFSTSPTFRVPAYVLIPTGLKGTAPAVIDLHSHGGMYLFGKEKVIDLGDNHPAMTAYQERNYDKRPTATALVQRGYVVISIDAFGFGERRVLLDADLKFGWDRSKYGADEVKHLNQQCRAKEATLVKALILAGATWPGIVCWDDLRTIDYLLTRPEVDSKRIGCLGISMGGYRSLYLSALDDRIVASCVTGFLSTVGPMIRAHLDTHSWVHFLPGLHHYLDLPDVASLAAPRALLVQQCARDQLFPSVGMKEAVEKIAGVYDRARAKEKFVARFYEVPHQFTRAMQDDAFAWLDRHLGHKPR